MPLDPDLIRQLQDPDPKRRQQAIVALGRSADLDALQPLLAVYHNDPEEEVRNLALKAGRHIKALHQEAQAAAATPVTPAAPPATTPPDTAEGDVESLTEHSRARWHYNNAMTLFVQGDRAKAALELGKALQSEPRLAQDSAFVQLAAEVTHKSPEAALELLQRSKPRTPSAGEPAKRLPKPSLFQRLQWIFLLLALGAVAVVIVLVISSGTLENYLLTANLDRWQQNVRIIGTTSYHVVVPSGERPASGWTALVALHGDTGDALSVLPAFGDFAEQEGILLIAPTFGEYGRPYSQNILPTLDDIIQQVDQDYGLNPFGAIFYGFSAGGEVATLYAESYPQRVAGIVTDGAPEIHPPPASRNLPYTIVYGENDSLRQATLDAVNRLQNQGYPITSEIVPGAGHEMTNRAIELTKELVRTTFNP